VSEVETDRHREREREIERQRGRSRKRGREREKERENWVPAVRRPGSERESRPAIMRRILRRDTKGKGLAFASKREREKRREII
jgi:hypothetical protein